LFVDRSVNARVVGFRGSTQPTGVIPLRVVEPQSEVIASYKAVRGHLPTLRICVYLRGLPTESLTEEEQDFMRTMEQVDAWYEAEIAEAEQRAGQKAKQESQQEIALRMFQEGIPLDVIARITQLSTEQLKSLQSQSGNN
jgi:hypothetical protein